MGISGRPIEYSTPTLHEVNMAENDPYEVALAACKRAQQTVSTLQHHAEEAQRICAEILDVCHQIDDLAKRLEDAEPESPS